MSRAKWMGVLLFALGVGGVGALVVHAEFAGNSMVVKSERTVVVPSRESLEQRIRSADKAANQSATQGMRDDCAALQKLAASDPACAQLSTRR